MSFINEKNDRFRRGLNFIDHAPEALLKLTEIRRRSLMDLVTSNTAGPELLAAIAGLGTLRADPRARERLDMIAKGRDPAAARAAAEALR